MWDLGAEPPAAGSKGVWGQSPQRLAIFTIFQLYKTVNDLETEHFFS